MPRCELCENQHSHEPEEFRISVCLKRYFTDERARCYVSVRPTGRSMRWLYERLQRLFSLAQPFILLSEGHLLPPDEPLALLRPGDKLDVIPKKDPWQRESCSNVTNIENATENEEHNKLNEDVNNWPLRTYGKTVWSSPNTNVNDSSNRVDDVMHDECDTGCSRLKLQVTSEADALECLKRRALSLLDEYYPDSNLTQETSETGPHRARRRRVRRRNRRPHDDQQQQSPSRQTEESQEFSHSSPSASTVTRIVHNESATRRAARLVHPLSPVSSVATN